MRVFMLPGVAGRHAHGNYGVESRQLNEFANYGSNVYQRKLDAVFLCPQVNSHQRAKSVGVDGTYTFQVEQQPPAILRAGHCFQGFRFESEGDAAAAYQGYGLAGSLDLNLQQ